MNLNLLTLSQAAAQAGSSAVLGSKFCHVLSGATQKRPWQKTQHFSNPISSSGQNTVTNSIWLLKWFHSKIKKLNVKSHWTGSISSLLGRGRAPVAQAGQERPDYICTLYSPVFSKTIKIWQLCSSRPPAPGPAWAAESEWDFFSSEWFSTHPGTVAVTRGTRRAGGFLFSALTTTHCYCAKTSKVKGSLTQE